MKLRWHRTCDQYGYKTEPTLQYMSDNEETLPNPQWEEIELVEEKIKVKER